MKRTVLVFSLLTACGDHEEQRPTPPAAEATEAPGQPATTGAVDSRTQYQLAEAIATANVGVPDDVDPRLAEVQTAWVDHRYRWEVMLVPELCVLADRCIVNAFDFSRLPNQSFQPWMPHLGFAPGEFERMKTECQGKSPCVVTFEGLLSRFEVSTETPTTLGFTDVHYRSSRTLHEGESWLRRNGAESHADDPTVQAARAEAEARRRAERR